jgi:nucleotide-binding universal stress UspA family protein
VHDEEETLYVDTPGVGTDVMRGHRVVVAVDGSAGSKAALKFALEDAARRGVPVEAVIAYRAPDLWEDYTAVGSPEEERLRKSLQHRHEDKVRAVVAEVIGGLSGPAADVQVRAALGSPADVLIRESHGADLLVVGSRGHGGLHTRLLGSTGMQCVMHASCPVTVVHSPEARRHRLRLHRDRHDERPGGADVVSEAPPVR